MTQRARVTRCHTISPRDMHKRETMREAEAVHRELEQYPPRPATRGECGTERPCPYVSCKYHLYLDVSPRTGSIKVNFPDLEVWELPETCALDIAERGGVLLEDIAAVMNITRERVRQLEMLGLKKHEAAMQEWKEESHG